MKDIVDRINDVHREVGSREVSGEQARTVRLRRTYHAAVEDVWDACTTAERVARWFLPVTGDLRLGGHYQLEGNAGGEILQCDPPEVLRVSWVMGDSDAFSEVRLRLTADGADRTVFDLEHTAVVPPEMWDQFGPGAVGVGWDGALVGLDMYLESGRGMDPAEAAAWNESEEARELMTRSSGAWGKAYAASGASAETVDSAVAATTAFYVPPREG
jgi:uncharacterized protein YndB with AHSA1/START domain